MEPPISGPSEIGTLYNKPLLQRKLFEVPKITCPIVIVHLEPLKEDNLSMKDKTAEFILSSTCPLFVGSTVLMSLLCNSFAINRLSAHVCKKVKKIWLFKQMWHQLNLTFSNPPKYLLILFWETAQWSSLFLHYSFYHF